MAAKKRKRKYRSVSMLVQEKEQRIMELLTIIDSLEKDKAHLLGRVKASDDAAAEAMKLKHLAETKRYRSEQLRRDLRAWLS